MYLSDTFTQLYHNTHLVLILLVFDPTVKRTLEHEPTYMICAVEPVWRKKGGGEREEGDGKRRKGGREK